ncbi:MAG: tRNA (adenosine(37)-N6)-threonylcarbamoyltransferase complex dimerization subunit type 1 TsaB, partial [Eggerthellaceae bacterium]|nr:tRNA (adenosine(37)-N6)-threonylcarbamoyltransferase complex dimerization subunit type 1 TsaB [Eggerthellaceae bacterium]
MSDTVASYAVALDTSNEVIAAGLGRLDDNSKAAIPVASKSVEAFRASNTKLLSTIDEVLKEAKVQKDELSCVVIGRGPGSFTGVRIALATAKGIASALEISLVGVSTIEAVAWQAQMAGYRGTLLVITDAMRKEVNYATFGLKDYGIRRLDVDRVEKAEIIALQYVHNSEKPYLTGDGLKKYLDLFGEADKILPEELWSPNGKGLLRAFSAAWDADECDPYDAKR